MKNLYGTLNTNPDLITLLSMNLSYIDTKRIREIRSNCHKSEMAWPDERSPFPVEKGSEEKKTPIKHE